MSETLTPAEYEARARAAADYLRECLAARARAKAELERAKVTERASREELSVWRVLLRLAVEGATL